MLQEEKFHDEHGRAWFVLAAGRNAESRESLARAVRATLPTVLAFFGDPASAHDRPLMEAGVKTRPDGGVREDFLTRLSHLAEEAGFGEAALAPGGELRADAYAIDWTAWDPDRRRIDPGGPSDELLAHISGSKNVEFRRT
jgi:1,2-phenylacetyl-CoA epoxidase catalytic subunit